MPLLEKWVRTREDWYPPYRPLKYGNPLDEDAVNVRLYGPNPGSASLLLCVWGADDCGYEILSKDGTLLRRLYDKIVDYTTQEELRNFGLKHC